MDYKIVTSHSGEDLTNKVKGYIQDGWKPVGSHQVSVRHQQNRFRGDQHMDTLNDLEYSQTIVREIPVSNKVEVGVYYYQDEDGKKVYDIEEMEREFQEKISKFETQPL